MPEHVEKVSMVQLHSYPRRWKHQLKMVGPGRRLHDRRRRIHLTVNTVHHTPPTSHRLPIRLRINQIRPIAMEVSRNHGVAELNRVLGRTTITDARLFDFILTPRRIDTLGIQSATLRTLTA